jgi:hypothetical protein
MAIIVSKSGKNAQKVERSRIEQEGYLQQYTLDNPEVIPLYDIKEDIRLLILAREFSTNSGPIDAIGIDKDGEIYIIETKLYKNPDKRTVVAQALDYGAALWQHSNDFDDFINTLNRSVQKVFEMTLNEKIEAFFGLSPEEIATLMERVKTNLADGVMHFVILMDSLDDRLKDLVLYVNQNSQFDIYIVELDYYKHEEYEIIIPKIYGAEVKKDVAIQKSSGSRQQWSEEEFLTSAKATIDTKDYPAFSKLYEACKASADGMRFGTGTVRGSVGPFYNSISRRTIFTLYTDGKLAFNFGWLNEPTSAIEFRDKYYQQLKAIGLSLKEEDISVFPHFPLDQWSPSVEKIIQVIQETAV